MLFNSLSFLLFFVAIATIYYLSPHKAKWLIMLAASIFFYMCFNPIHVIVLFVVTTISFFAGMWVYGAKDSDNEKKGKKTILVVGVVFSFIFLAIGKYADFFMQNIYFLLDMAKIQYTTSNMKIALPVGISFFTFKAVSYVIDSYRGKILEKNFLKYLLYVSFFPQIASGPIERSTKLIPQLTEEHKFIPENIKIGLCTMLIGFFKKMVVADNLSSVVSKVFSSPEMYSPLVLFGIACVYSIQIFCDFSGYSDIAIGCTKVLGIETTQNFDYPYFANSIADFWKRWHISLSSWFRDYLYIPLGGNRKGIVRKYINLMIVFLVSGLWHGASWNFVFWGFLHAAYQIVGAITIKFRKAFNEFTHIAKHQRIHRFLQVAITFILVTFAWIFFKANSIYDGFNYVKCMFVNTSGAFDLGTVFEQINIAFGDKKAIISFIVAISLFITYTFFDYKKRLCEYIFNKRIVIKIIFFVLFIVLIVLFVPTGVSDFIYVRF